MLSLVAPVSACRLLALDLDGTLLRRDGGIAPEDAAAIGRARAAGLRVVLASGRLPGGCLPVAQALQLEQPLICVDGAGTFSPRGDRALSRWPVPAAARGALIEICRQQALTPLFLGATAVHGRRSDQPAAVYLSGWSRQFRPVDRWASIVNATGQLAPLAAFAVGAAPATAAAAAGLEGLAGVVWERFELGPGQPHALRVRHRRADKGQALAALAATMGLPAPSVAAVGDWFNDIPMLRWASRSFVMQGVPAAVAASAGQQLRALAGAGGGVAEVIGWLLDGGGSA